MDKYQDLNLFAAEALDIRLTDLYTGACLSGKSTVLKQMRFVYSNTFSVMEREEVRRIILDNILVACMITLEEMKSMGLGFESEFSVVSNNNINGSWVLISASVTRRFFESSMLNTEITKRSLTTSSRSS